ncbi:hypothetical protein V1511DRAFT_31939 [Dipodascopsis uninucleata]
MARLDNSSRHAGSRSPSRSRSPLNDVSRSPSKSPSPVRGRSRERSYSSSGGSRPSSRSLSGSQRSYSRSRSNSYDSRSSRSYSRSYSPRSRTPDSQSRSRSRSRSLSYDSRSLSPGYSRSPTPERSRNSTILAENLTRNVTEDHVREIFGNYGTIDEVDFPMNKRLNINRGICYITYSHPEEASRTIQHMHDGYIDGAQIIVKMSNSRRSRPYSISPPPSRNRGVRSSFGGNGRRSGGGFSGPQRSGRGGRWGGRRGGDSYVPPPRRRSRSPPPYHRRSPPPPRRYRSPMNGRRTSVSPVRTRRDSWSRN